MIEQMIPIGDTPLVAAGFLKQNFKVKFESRNIKLIAWQHSCAWILLVKEKWWKT